MNQPVFSTVSRLHKKKTESLVQSVRGGLIEPKISNAGKLPGFAIWGGKMGLGVDVFI